MVNKDEYIKTSTLSPLKGENKGRPGLKPPNATDNPQT